MKPIAEMSQIELAAYVHDHLRRAMASLGFIEDGRHFYHPENSHIIEFPAGPLSVGEEPVMCRK
jgi:hypothetical protein